MIPELVEWLVEFAPSFFLIWWNRNGPAIVIEDPKQAMHFKLTWL